MTITKIKTVTSILKLKVLEVEKQEALRTKGDQLRLNYLQGQLMAYKECFAILDPQYLSIFH